MEKRFTFVAGSETLAAVSYTKWEELPHVLSLHGAGPATKERVKYLAPLFLEKGFSMLAFDFSGHGESTGSLNESSLQKRIDEAHEAMKLLDPNAKLTVMGSSMGGHIALELLKTGRVENLILFCPAVYSDAAISLQFDQWFTEEIRKPDGWKSSSLFGELEKFTGRLIIVIWEEDNVIPQEVIGMLVASAKSITHRELIFVPGAWHAIHTWLEEHPEDFAHVTKKIFDHL